jgi:hypothetical protein
MSFILVLILSSGMNREKSRETCRGTGLFLAFIVAEGFEAKRQRDTIVKGEK